MLELSITQKWHVAILFCGLLLLSSLPVIASGGGNHPHADEPKHKGQGAHLHERWLEPPPPYAGKQNHHWNDQSMINKGKNLYAENCLDCHGKDGRGKGPMAKELAHPPADLTNHFHCLSGKGDDYLFWRVSEGGEVAPFEATNSAMPSFKDIFSKKERWAVLNYAHAAFHAKGSENCDKGEKAHE